MHLQCNFITHYPRVRLRICMNVKKMARPWFNRQSIIKTQTYHNKKRWEIQDRHMLEPSRKWSNAKYGNNEAWPGELQRRSM